MKRTLLALLVGLSLLLSLAACGSRRTSAQEVTEQGLAALRDLDVLALPQYWNTDGLNLDDLGELTQAGEEVDLSAEDTAALAQAMTRHLSWQVISAQEDPGAGTASVTVSLTNLDMAPGGGPVPAGGFFRRVELRPPGRRPAAHGGGDDPAVPPDPHRPVEPGGPGHPDHHGGGSLTLVDGQWKITPDEAVADALLGACSPQGRPSPACWRSAPPDRLSLPRPANGPSPGGEGPFRFPGRAKARRLGGAPWASGPVSRAVVAAAGPIGLLLHPRQGAGGRIPPRGSGSGGRSRRDPRPRPRRRRRTPGWACSSRTWG